MLATKLICCYITCTQLPETGEESVVSVRSAEVPLRVEVSAASDVAPRINDYIICSSLDKILLHSYLLSILP